MAETRKQYLARVARVHDEWVNKHMEDVPFNPDSHPGSEDYNMWYVDMEADAEATSEFMRNTAPPAEGFAPEPERLIRDSPSQHRSNRD